MSQRSNPFRGPRPFKIGDSESFFGRGLENELLLRQVLSSRVVLVHAPTGTGKSSLINASLVPALAGRGFLTPHREAFRPSRLFGGEGSGGSLPDPNCFTRSKWLHAALAESLSGEEAATEPDQKLKTYPWDAVGRTLILVDQVEEIFTANDIAAHRREKAFFSALGELSYQTKIWMVLVVREDFLAKALAHALRFDGGLRSRFAVPLLSLATTREIISETLGSINEEIGKDQMESLSMAVAAASTGRAERDLLFLEEFPIVEPLILQLLCRTWVELSDGHPLSSVAIPDNLADLSLAGYVDNSLSDSAQRATATGTADSHPRSDVGATVLEDQIREWCEDQLVEGRTRRQALLPETSDSLAAGLRELLEGGLLTKRLGGRIELAHDRFVDALVESNTEWYRRRDEAVVGQRRRWVRGGKLDKDLLTTADIISGWSSLKSPDSTSREFVRTSLNAFMRRITLMTIIFAVMVLVPLASFLVLRSKSAAAQDELEAARDKLDEAVGFRLEAYRQVEDAEENLSDMRDKSRAMSLSQASLVLGESNSEDEYSLSLGLRGFELARNENVERGSIAKALARSALLRRSTDQFFVRRRFLDESPIGDRRIAFDRNGTLWICSDHGPAVLLGNPFPTKEWPKDAPDSICGNQSSVVLDTPIIGEIRVTMREKHSQAGSNQAYKFARVEIVGKPESERLISLNESSKSRLTAHAGERYPALQATDEIAAKSVKHIYREDPDEDYVLGLSVTSEGAGFMWRADTEKLVHCFGEGTSCSAGGLIDAGWMTMGTPAAAWISSDGTAARVASVLGEVVQIELDPMTVDLRPPGNAKLPIKEILVVNDRLLAADQSRYFEYSRDEPLSSESETGEFPSCSTSGGFYPRVLASFDGGKSILAIGRDSCLATADATDLPLRFIKPSSHSTTDLGKLWVDGSEAIHIKDISTNEPLDERPPQGSVQFLVLSKNKGKEGKLHLILKSGKGKISSDEPSDEESIRIPIRPQGTNLVAFDVVDSLIALGFRSHSELAGAIAICSFHPLESKEVLSNCFLGSAPKSRYSAAGVQNGMGVTGLAFSPVFGSSRASGAAHPEAYTFLAAATTVGTVELYSVKLRSDQGEGASMHHISTTRPHIREALGVAWATIDTTGNGSQNSNKTHLLASYGKDGRVTITDVPQAFARDDLSVEDLGQILVPVSLHQHSYPITSALFDGERLFVGGEDGWFRMFDLRPQHLVQRACDLLLRADLADGQGLISDREKGLCQGPSPSTNR